MLVREARRREAQVGVVGLVLQVCCKVNKEECASDISQRTTNLNTYKIGKTLVTKLPMLAAFPIESPCLLMIPPILLNSDAPLSRSSSSKAARATSSMIFSNSRRLSISLSSSRAKSSRRSSTSRR